MYCCSASMRADKQHAIMDSDNDGMMDCTQLPIRMREICEGKSGLAPEEEERYRQLWSGNPPAGSAPRRIRLGDLVSWLISWFWTETPTCGCPARRERLNQLGYRIVDRFWRITKP